MCARRFLTFIFVMTLLFVAGVFAFFQWGGKILIQEATPQGHFQAPAPRSGPDYSKLDSWIARPDIPENPSTAAFNGGRPARAISASAQIFYIHPTTYLRRDHWNGPVDDPESRQRAELFVRSQASAFAASGSVWAPRYRQAAYGAFLLRNEDAQKALELAYSDVSAAFDEFLKRNPDGPIVLAGHSQGALHLLRLLRERSPQLKGRLVAAYVVGWPISVTADLPAAGLEPCTSRDQPGCVLSWQSFGSPPNPDLILDAWEGTKGPTGVERKRDDMLCVNPLTGTKDGAAPPKDNPGTLVPTPNLQAASLLDGQVGAHCDKGLLILDGQIPALGQFVLPGNNYHVYDYALFWAAIRDDAARRLAAWQR